MRQKTTATKIGQYLKYQREKRGLTLAQFAEMTSLDASFIHRVEKGYYNGVSFDAVEKIARGLDMPLSDFLAKCDITPARFALPIFDYYLKEQFQLPPQAIEDMKLFLQFIEQKYHDEIVEMKKKHTEYWKKKSSKKQKSFDAESQEE